jgi:hypothetical protein
MSKHTVTVSLEDEDYDALKELAEEQDRYISGQARHMLRRALRGPLADTHMAGAGSAPDTHDLTGSAEPVPSATYVDPASAKQGPLPG